MEISSSRPISDPFSRNSPPPTSADSVERRQLMQATRTVNESGLLGHNQVVFMVDRATHKPIIRLEDRESHEVILQLPPEYVLRLAQDIRAGSPQITPPAADT